MHSYEFQEEYWKHAFDDNPDTELVGIYADPGISGHSIERRPQFLLMVQDAREHKFDKIYTKSVARFARNTTQLLEAIRELRDIGIEVIFENENIHTFDPTSEIYLTIAATIAENDLEVDSQRMRWSVRHRFENGWISIGNGMYGLKLVGDNNLEVVPEEAAVVRYVFDQYVNGGIGSTRIAQSLNEAGVKTRSGAAWSGMRIVTMLRNEKYKGDSLMGKSVCHFNEYHNNKDGKYAPLYYTENTHEAIVEKDVWDAAQRIMNERGKNSHGLNPEYTFTRMIECGCCGGNFRHKINNCNLPYRSEIWVCNNQLEHGVKTCPNSRIKDSVLKEKFVEAYNEFILKRPQGDSMIALQEVLEEQRDQERELAELMLQHLISKEAYETERKDIKARIAATKEKIAGLRLKHVSENEHTPITEFDEKKAKRFLTKVIVKKHTVTFVFYNGAKIPRKYDNGRPGNKVGWYWKKEETKWKQQREG